MYGICQQPFPPAGAARSSLAEALERRLPGLPGLRGVLVRFRGSSGAFRNCIWTSFLICGKLKYQEKIGKE